MEGCMIEKEILDRAQKVIDRLGTEEDYDVEDLHREYGIDDEAVADLCAAQVKEAVFDGKILGPITDDMQVSGEGIMTALGALYIAGFETGVVAARMELADA
jgi:hypothetical protein